MIMPSWLHSAILAPRLCDLLFGALLFWAGYRSEASKNAPIGFRLRNTVILIVIASGFLAFVMLEGALVPAVFHEPVVTGFLLLVAFWALYGLQADLAARKARGSRYPEFEDGPDRTQVRQRLAVGDYLVVVENHRILIGRRGRLASFAARLAVPLVLAAILWTLRLPDYLCALPLGWVLGIAVRELRLKTLLAFHGMQAVIAGQSFGEVDTVSVIVTNAAGKHRVCLTTGYGSQRRNSVLIRLDDPKIARRMAEVVRAFMDAQTDPAFRPPTARTRSRKR